MPSAMREVKVNTRFTAFFFIFKILTNFLIWVSISCGLHGSVVISTVTSQQEGSRFDSMLGPFFVEFSQSICVASLQVLRLPPTPQKCAVVVGGVVGCAGTPCIETSVLAAVGPGLSPAPDGLCCMSAPCYLSLSYCSIHST